MIIDKVNWNTYLNKETLLEIFCNDKYPNTFSLGYMIANIDKYYIFKTIDETGYLDGYELYQKDSINKIKKDTNYCKMFTFYINYLKEKDCFDNLDLKTAYDKVPKDSINGILQYCFDHDMVITITQVDGEYYETGKVISVTNQEIVLDQRTYTEDLEESENLAKVRNKAIKIDNILSIKIITKETYLYQRYLERKNKRFMQ